MKIRVLDEKTINKIAAGEVVENPASVVKELVENAVDAGASGITVEVEGGGFHLISVSDDGSGMSFDDAMLSLERHGTSKIREAKDLEAIRTMGFRGEALASINAISKLTLRTAEEGSVGTEIVCGRQGKCVRSRGTTIEVRSLFYNVPARKKFQKSETAQVSEIVKVMTKLSLSARGVAFKLVSNGRTLFETQGDDLKEQIRDLLGKSFLEGAYEVNFEGITGYIGSMKNVRHSRSGQYLFINGRAVQSMPLVYGVEDALGTRLGTREYPIFVLFVEMDPSDVDVNVHPQKLQVRLKDEGKMREQMRKAIAKALVREERPVAVKPLTLAEPVASFQGTFSFEDASAAVEEVATLPEIEVIGFYRHFMIINKEGLLLVNLRAASARLYFDRVSGEKELARQSLLLPLTFEFPLHEAKKLQERLDEFRKVGIGMRELGENAFIVDELAEDLTVEDVRAVLDELPSGRERQLALHVCRSMKKEKVSRHQALEIYERLQESSSPEICPLGHKTMVHFTEEGLEKLFG